MHEIFRLLMGANYVGPVRLILGSPGDPRERRKRVLDLGTGNGRWLLEMAEEFPRVQFLGTDIVPIATRYPPRNVFFMVEDLNERWGWEDAHFDLIHARNISMAVTDYPRLIQQVTRTLRPGGLFISLERGRYASTMTSPFSSSRTDTLPETANFYNLINEALPSRSPTENDICALLAATGRFRDITVQKIVVPIGPWAGPIGIAYRQCMVRYAESVWCMLRERCERELEENGMGNASLIAQRERIEMEARVNSVVRGFVKEMKTRSQGMCTEFWVVMAVKV